MNFPVFNDASGNAILAKECATLIEHGATALSCSDRNPFGKIVYFTLPYLLSDDPVTVNYLTLALKIATFALFSVSAAWLAVRLASEAEATLADWQRRVAQSGAGLLVLALCLNNIPIRLTDMEAACFATIAVMLAIRALRWCETATSPPLALLFWCCTFMNLAGLFKQSFFVHESLLIAAFCLSIHRGSLVRLLRDWRVYAVVAVGNVGVVLQLLYVWHHFGNIGLTDPTVMQAVATARRFPFVAMEIYTIPQNGAYMLSVDGETSSFGWWLYKVYYALKTTDVYVYGGTAKTMGLIVPSFASYWFKVYAYSAVMFAAIVASVIYGVRSVRFTTLTALFVLLFMVSYQHIEPRYFIFPKLLLGLVAGYWIWRGWFALRQRKPVEEPV